jgi:hypothetical protein
MRQIAFRAEDEVAKRLDEVAAAMQAKDPEYMGTEVSRSAVLRTLVLRGLLSTELQYDIALPPQKATYQLYKFWKRRLQEMRDEQFALERLVMQWDELANEHEAGWMEREELDNARKRRVIAEAKQLGLEVRDKNDKNDQG